MIAQGIELGVFMGTNDDSVRVVRDARGCDLLAWMVPGAATIPDGEREQDRAFRAWLEKCVSCPLNGGGA